MKNKFDCLVIGDVMFDVFMGESGKTLSFLRHGTSYCTSAKIDFGGAGNVAEGLSWLGGRVSFVGKAGDDSWGRLYEANLNSKGVITNIFFEHQISTGITFVGLHEKGHRSFLVFRGANDRLCGKEIGQSTRLIKKSKYLYLCGYSLVASPQKEAILHALTLAKKHNVKVFFDPGAHNLIRSNFELFDALFHSCDVFCPNLDEAKAIFKTNNLETIIQKLRKSDKFTALKCGACGCVLINETGFVRVPAFRVDCLDTTGAGDAFGAAFIFGLVNRFPLVSIGRMANWFAAQVTKGIGARNYPDKAQVGTLLAQIRKHMDIAYAEP